MKLHIVVYYLWSISLYCVYGIPVSQPAVFTGTQYINSPLPASYPAQRQQQPTYLQQISQQPQYITANLLQQSPSPIYNDAQRIPQQFIPQPPTQKVPQLLLPSNVDRQVQKVAHQNGGLNYAQQISAVQKQTQANNVLAAAQRRAQEQVRLIQQQQEFERQRQIDSLRPQEPHIVYFGAGGGQQQHQQQQQQQPQYQQYQQQQAHSQPVLRTISGGYGNDILRQKNDEIPEEHDNNASYQFGFDVKDDQYTNYQNRKEQREGGKITGSYSVVDSDGFIRTVTYTADPKEGFKAEVVRQPTDIVVKIPTPSPVVREQQQQQYIQEVPTNKGSQGQKQNVVYRMGLLKP